MNKISIGQIIAELICRDLDSKEYNIFSDSWNKMSIEDRDEIIRGITEYCTEQIGTDNIED